MRGFVVHSGDYLGGHYTSYIKMNQENIPWILFNDDSVELFSSLNISDVAFGGKSQDFKELVGYSEFSSEAMMKPNNAYLLFYERKEEGSIIATPTGDSEEGYNRNLADISKTVAANLKEELEGKYAREYLFEDSFGILSKKLINIF